MPKQSLPKLPDDTEYLIWNHELGGWWKENGGTTRDLQDAQRFTLSNAQYWYGQFHPVLSIMALPTGKDHFGFTPEERAEFLGELQSAIRRLGIESPVAVGTIYGILRTMPVLQEDSPEDS